MRAPNATTTISLCKRLAQRTDHVGVSFTARLTNALLNGPPHAEETSPRVLLLSMQAGGVGLNLVSANHCVVVDLPFNPATLDQVSMTSSTLFHRVICRVLTTSTSLRSSTTPRTRQFKQHWRERRKTVVIFLSRSLISLS